MEGKTTNPFNMFKRYRTTLKDEEIETAYKREGNLIRPFHVFQRILYFVIFLIILTLIYELFAYFELIESLPLIFWLSALLTCIIIAKLLAFLRNKYPKYNNLIGMAGMTIIFVLIIETNIYIHNPFFALI